MVSISKENPLLLQMDNIVKDFPGVRALDMVNFKLQKGEVHVLLGENGAGKSTMIKVLAGAHSPDEGNIYIEGREVHIQDPRKGEKLGIGVIYQEFNLVPYISVAENIFLGRLPLRKGTLFVNWKKLYADAESLLEKIGVRMDPETQVKNLTVAEQQMVEIAKAVALDAKIIVMDEPTAPLSAKEVDRLFSIVEQFRMEGKGIIYISHRMEEIFRIGDRISVLRDGKYVGTLLVEEANEDVLIQMMVGHKIEKRFPWEERIRREAVLSVHGLTSEGAFQDISFDLHKGEILGIAGLMGCGRSELMQALFGAYPIDGGNIKLNGRDTIFNNPKSAINEKIGYLPADRKKEGLILSLSVAKNMTLTCLLDICRRGFLNIEREQEIVKFYQKKLNIKTQSTSTEVAYLSGGNQQKVMLAKWLCSDVNIILFDEPTRGIDVGAKNEIYHLLVDLAKAGKSVILISSELPELLGMSDRVLVMRRGVVTAEFERKEATQENILHYMVIEQTDGFLG